LGALLREPEIHNPRGEYRFRACTSSRLTPTDGASRNDGKAAANVARTNGRRPGLVNGRLQAHMPGTATIVRCDCGAEYRRTETKFLLPHTGGEVCGAALEAWWESTNVPPFELVRRPDGKPA
jgi:hypothetical protein